MIELEINTAIAERARAGERLSEAELQELDAADVLSLGMLADEARRARVGDGVRYTRVLTLKSGADTPPEQELAASHEVRLVEPAATLAETVALVKAARAAAGGDRRLTGFSVTDVEARGWASLEEVAAALRAAGLDAFAEAAVDEVSAAQLMAVYRGGLPVATLSVRRSGDGERVSRLMTVRALVDACPQVQAFAPLAREQSVTAPTTGYHDVKMVALARLALPAVPVIGVDWQQYGPKLAQVALTFGANHLDGVSPRDEEALGHRRASVADVRRNIEAAGFRPVEDGQPL